MSPMEYQHSNLKRISALIATAALIALALRAFVFGLYVIPSSSMVPTLLMGDYIFATNYTYGYSAVATFGGLIKTAGRWGGTPPSRGEIIVFKSPANQNNTLIKRLIGLPGDKIKMVKSQLHINGKPVRRERLKSSLAFPGDDESTDDYLDYVEYLPGGATHAIRLQRQMEDEETVNNTAEITVPPHYYFFMGDNRDKSEDSRISNVGLVPEENIVSRAKTIFFSKSYKVRLWEISKLSWAIRWHRLFKKIQ